MVTATHSAATHSERVRFKILDAGMALWPYTSLRSIAARVQMTHSAVLYHFKSTEAMNAAIKRRAVETGRSSIIVQLIACQDEAIAQMGPAERARHMAAV